MSDETDTQEKPKISWASRLWKAVKWTMIAGVILFILLSVLARIGGNSDVLRESVEQFISENTPYSAHLAKLNEMRFFPDVVLDVEGLELRGGENGAGEAAIRIGEARVVMGFFDMLYRPGRFKALDAADISVLSGTFVDQPMTFSRIAIIEGESAQPQFVAEGEIAEDALAVRVDLVKIGKAYKVPDEKAFEAALADLKLTGVLRYSAGAAAMKLENLALALGEDQALRANLDLELQEGGRLALKGQMRIAPGQSALDPNVVIHSDKEPPSVFGSLRSEHIILEDFAGDAPLMRGLSELVRIFGGNDKRGENDEEMSGAALAGLAADIHLDLRNIQGGGIQWGRVKTPVKREEDGRALHIGPLSGEIINGALGGDIRVSAAEGGGLKLVNKVTVKDFDYAALQRQFMEEAELEGTAHVSLDLESKGENAGALIERLSGKVGLVGGRGWLRSGLLNVWGGGLLNALLPSFGEESDLELNCVVANLDVKNLKAQSDAVFVDAKRVTLHGEGTYDLKTDHLEMLLEPKPKGVSIGDVGAAVNVSGPLSDLKVSPNAFDLGKKIGGIVLGAANPAFYALSFAGMGLGDDHPCKAFVIEKEVLPEPKFETKSEEEAAPLVPAGQGENP